MKVRGTEGLIKLIHIKHKVQFQNKIVLIRDIVKHKNCVSILNVFEGLRDDDDDKRGPHLDFFIGDRKCMLDTLIKGNNLYLLQHWVNMLKARNQFDKISKYFDDPQLLNNIDLYKDMILGEDMIEYLVLNGFNYRKYFKNIDDLLNHSNSPQLIEYYLKK